MSDAPRSLAPCGLCGVPLSPREDLFNRALGRERNVRCLSCLASEQGRDVADLEAVLMRHVARRACFSDELGQLEAAAPDRPEAFAPAEPVAFDPMEVSHLRRYSRQLVLPQVGDAGQGRLSQARVLVVGAGALGSPVALYLAAAGVGSLRLVDPDAVDLSNLQRQILHGTPDVGRPKVASAAHRLADLNPLVQVEARIERLTGENAADLVADVDVVVDASDNPETRHALNRACVEGRKPWVHGAIWRFFGQVTVFEAGGRPCYRCLFPEAPDSEELSCEVAGVMGATAGIIGSVQAQETLRLLLGEQSPLSGVLWTYDGWTMYVERMRYLADPACPVCGR